MIIDRLEHIGSYRGMHRHMDRAIDYLLSHDLAALPEGRTEIDGERVFVMISSPALSDNRVWEKHRLYADIQIALMDGESIAWAHADSLSGFSPYDAQQGDIQKSLDPAEGILCPIPKDCFGIYLPHDAHRPGIGQGHTRKAVVKVKLC